jgi:hypothetical protein
MIHNGNEIELGPFAGMMMARFVRATSVRGCKVFDNGWVTVEPGAGQFIRPKRATTS